jgi:hypothetical protein
MSYNLKILIPKDEAILVPGKIEQFKKDAINKAVARAVTLKLAGSGDELDVRPLQNIRDFATALDQWNTAALAVVGTAYSVFQAVAAPAIPANKLIVFYGVGIETIPLPASLLTFRRAAIAGNIMAQFDLEQLVNCQTQEGYFSEPIVIEPQTTFACQVTARIAGGAARVQLMGFAVERKGETITA